MRRADQSHPHGQKLPRLLQPPAGYAGRGLQVHGLGNEFLADKPLFKDVADDFLDFVGDSVLVIHNAPFDMGFLQAELEWAKKRRLENEVIDTVVLARKKHPGARVNLDALCRHYGIDNARRTLHGALLDSEILAEVYLELIGGRQVGLSLAAQSQDEDNAGKIIKKEAARQRPAPLPSRLSEEQLQRHKDFVLHMNEEALWAKYWS